MIRMIRKEVQKALQTASNFVRRALISVAPTTSYVLQAQGAGDDSFTDVELWQQFGFASRPPVQGEVLLVMPFGRGEGAIACATHDRAHRPTDLTANEVAIYGYKSGAIQGQIRMKANGDIDIIPGAGQVARVGASSACEFLLLGATTMGHLKTFADAVKAITPGDAVANAIALGVIKAAALALSTSTSTWLCAIAKGK